MFIHTTMRTSDFKGMSDKTGVPKEQVNICGSFFFSLFDASYSAFNGGSVRNTKVI